MFRFFQSDSALEIMNKFKGVDWYKKTNCEKCPFCGSNQIDCSDEQPNGIELYRFLYCSKCDKVFVLENVIYED